jgi:preprotein translocase SecE subunit
VFYIGEEMAEQKNKKRRVVKKSETVRQRADKKQAEVKPRRIHRATSQAARPLKAASRIGRREYYIPLPDNRAGRFLNKRRHLMPRFFREAWAEVRQVTWPGRRETIKLTLAVFTFALVFGGLIWLTDYGLENLFRKVILQ